MKVLLHPSALTPPHRVTHPEKAHALAEEFARSGWGNEHPALVGYRFGSGVQLLTGSHRWAAAKSVGLAVPVVVHEYETVERAWGTDGWRALIESGDAA